MKREQSLKKLSLVFLCAFVLLSIPIFASPGLAVDDSVCARVKLEIRQELTLERQAFDAHMRIGNGFSHITLEDIDVDIKFTDAAGNSVLASTDPGNTTALFFYRLDSMDNIDDVDGNGTVAPVTTADIHWLIIPAYGASNGVPQGTLYYVGATLTYTIGGEEHVTEVNPDYIFVKPMPRFTLDYFLPADVYGDDAFTPEIEPPVPFSLGVRVKNTGFGVARNMKIESAQPKIVENKQGLLIGFVIEGSEVNGQPASPSLLVNFGDVAPNTAAVARWIMTCTLSGRFVEFTADWSHSDELGGELTSLLEEVNTHFLVRDVLVDVTGRDGIRDFLAKDGDVYRVYESENVDTVVTDQSASSTLSDTGNSYTLTTPVTAGFIYVKVSDPYAGQKEIKGVIRSDGKRIKPENAWLSKTRKGSQEWEYFLNLFDANTTGSYYVDFGEAPVQNNPPVLQFIPDRTAVVGKQLSFVVAASDPDGTIPSLSAAPLPALATFTDQGNGTGIFDWTPAQGQVGRYELTFTASDGELKDYQRVVITVNPSHDTDGDGMDDDWELEHFGSLERDGSGDFDGDGISDLDEFRNGTDPTVCNYPPTAPVIASPQPGDEVTTLQPELVIENSTDPNGDAITYVFELYADEEMTALVAGASDVPEGTETTSWAVPVALNDNTWYFWRVRATDGFSYSLWVYGGFFVNTANDPPEPFQISSPRDGAEVGAQTPALEVTNSTDPDEDALVYTFEVYADDSMNTLITSAAGIAEGPEGSTVWMVDTKLTQATTYYWRAIVTDEHGATAETALASFTVNTQNAAPGMPLISTPAPGSEVTTQELDLVISNAADPDGDTLTYFFELDTVNTFDSPAVQSSGEIAEGVDTTLWHRGGLADNTWYYWRAKASDGKAESAWVQGSFYLNTANEPPSTPTIKNPGNGAWVDTRTPILAVNPAKDPDGDTITYIFEVYANPGLGTIITQGASDTTWWSVPAPLGDNTRYYWRARARDEHGASSAWSELSQFFVKDNGVDDPPIISVIEPTEDMLTNENDILIRWEDSDPDTNADIALYYDTDQAGADGTLIAEGLKEDPDGTQDSFLWDISGVGDGTYYVYATITDGTATMTSYSPGGITRDMTPPVISASISPVATAHGWHKSDVTVSYTVSDNLSGIDEAKSSFADDVVTEEGKGISVGAEVYDKAGNVATITEIINLDKTLPTITVASRLPEPNSLGWNTSPVTIKYSVSDALSGVDEAIGGYEDDVLATEGEDQSVSGSVTDKAGNTSSVTMTDINIDVTLPAVQIISPTPDSIIREPFDLTVKATDSVSGVAQVEYQRDGGAWQPLPLVDPPTGTYSTTWTPEQGDEGPHIIQFRATDRAGNLSGPASVSIVIELKTPFERLTGTISVSPDPVYQGQETSFIYEITNETAAAIKDLVVRVLIVDTGTGAITKTLEGTATVPPAGTATGNLNISSLELAPQVYTAELWVVSAEAPEPRVLASADFEVRPSIEVTETVADPINLLVWVNDRCHHKPHQGDEGERGDDDEDEGDDEEEVEGAESKGKRCDPKKCIRVDLLEAILAQAVDSYLIVYERTDFEEELRNPYYTDILILGEGHPLTDHYAEELRERVCSGTGLVSSLWLKHGQDEDDDDDDDGIYDPIFGMRYKGKISGKVHTVTLVPSPITGEGTIKAVGKANKVEASAEATVAGWIEERRHGDHGRKPKPHDRHPAIVINEYGLGRAIYFAFDLGVTLNDENRAQIAGLITNSIAYVHRTPQEATFLPYQLIPIDLAVKGLGGAFDVRITETFPPELPLYDLATGEWITEIPWTITMHLKPDEVGVVRYCALTPDAAGTYTIETEVGFTAGGSYIPYYTSSIRIVVDADAAALTAGIITTLKSLSVSGKDQPKVKNAIKYLERVQGREIVTARDVDRNIHDILKAIDCLLQITSTDVTEIRLMLDSLLRVEQGIYFLFPES